jgi:hypothetical protein
MEHPKNLSPVERYLIVRDYLDAHGFPFLKLPTWGRYSVYATKRQKFLLREEKMHDERFLESLSKEQASLIIARLLDRI